MDAACIGLRALELIDAGEVIDGREFLVQGRLQGVSAVQSLNKVTENLRFLVGEVYELRQILERGRHLDDTVDIPADFLHGESQFLEGVDIAVDGPVGCVQFLGQFLDREIDIACHKAHEPEDSFYSWLFHGSLSCFDKDNKNPRNLDDICQKKILNWLYILQGICWVK